MLKDLICGKQVYVVTGYTDLRTRECSCFAAGDVTESKDCFGKVMDFCCCTKGLIMENFNGPAMKERQNF